jgi:2,3-bisphosphoglycerate-dependent phosphoglycerate mutase
MYSAFFVVYLLVFQLQQFGCFKQNFLRTSRVCSTFESYQLGIRSSCSAINLQQVDSQVENDGYIRSDGHVFSNLFRKMNPLNNKEPGTLILVRHGQTTMNYNKTFTGWIDVDLSENGKREVEHAARLLLERGYTVDVTYTSRLKRAIRSSWIILKELGQIYRPVFKSYRLNERMYGALEGKGKVQTCIEFGEENVAAFRTGLSARPPAMSRDHPNWHGNETKYSDLDPSCIPVSESLQDTMDRTLPLLAKRIIPDLLLGKTVLVVAHANSLRGVVKYIDDLSEEQITRVGIPNGIPLIFKFKVEDGKLKPIVQEKSEAPISGEFMEKKGLLRKLLEKEKELAKRVPGFVPPPIIPLDALEKSLVPSNISLRTTTIGKDLGVLSDEGDDYDEYDSCILADGSGGSSDKEAGMSTTPTKKIDYNYTKVNTDVVANLSVIKDGDGNSEVQRFEEEVGGVQIDERMREYERESGSTQRTLWDPKIRALAALDRDRQILQLIDGTLWDPVLGQNTGIKDILGKKINVTPKRIGSTSTGGQKGTGPSGQYIVIIRHGKTEYNKLGLFTGWEDVSLAREGVKEAMEAGNIVIFYLFHDGLFRDLY